MSKLIRFDETHFGYLTDYDLDMDTAVNMATSWRKRVWPGTKLIVMQADEFIDLTGQYEIVPIADMAEPLAGVGPSSDTRGLS